MPKEKSKKIEEKGKEEEESKKSKKKEIDKYVIGSQIFRRCLCLLAIIYFVDILLGVCGFEHAGVTEEVLETVKTLLFTISGYLFGKNASYYSECKSENENVTGKDK